MFIVTEDVVRQASTCSSLIATPAAGQRIAQPVGQLFFAGVVEIQLAARGWPKVSVRTVLHGVPVGVHVALALAAWLPHLDHVHTPLPLMSLTLTSPLTFWSMAARILLSSGVGEFHLDQRALLEIDAVFETTLGDDARQSSHASAPARR